MCICSSVYVKHSLSDDTGNYFQNFKSNNVYDHIVSHNVHLNDFLLEWFWSGTSNRMRWEKEKREKIKNKTQYPSPGNNNNNNNKHFWKNSKQKYNIRNVEQKLFGVLCAIVLFGSI